MVDCEFIPEQLYSDFGEKLSADAANKRIPLSATIEVTYRCNNRCVHCYQEGGHQGLKGQSELSLQEWAGIFDQMVGLGTLWLQFTGGEIFTRPDMLDIYDQARKRGMLVSLLTNGTLITPQIADHLAEDKPILMEISLYGYSQETFERVTGIPGSYARCMRGIELIMQRGIRLNLKTVLLQQNRHELWEMKRFVESLGLNFRYDANIIGGFWETNSPKAARLSPQEIVEFDQQDGKRGPLWRKEYEKYKDVPATAKLFPYRYRCMAGQRSYHIDPYGKLSMCTVEREPGYDLRQGSLEEGWNTALYQTRSQPAANSLHEDCNTCGLFMVCYQCPGWQRLEGLSDGQKPQFLCDIAHLRSKMI